MQEGKSPIHPHNQHKFHLPICRARTHTSIPGPQNIANLCFPKRPFRTIPISFPSPLIPSIPHPPFITQLSPSPSPPKPPQPNPQTPPSPSPVAPPRNRSLHRRRIHAGTRRRTGRHTPLAATATAAYTTLPTRCGGRRGGCLRVSFVTIRSTRRHCG